MQCAKLAHSTMTRLLNYILDILDPNIPSRAFTIWLTMNILVFGVLHLFATRPVIVHVDDYREAGLYDDQVVVIALRELERSADNFWWISNRTPVLVLPKSTPLQIDAAMLRYASIKVEQYDRGNLTLNLANIFKL
jgi:hypothetical protein